MKQYEIETQQLYNNMDRVWPENNLWYYYTRSIIFKFIESNFNKFVSKQTKVLNAGSGGSEYHIKGEIYHVDLAENLIRNFPRYYVSSIEDMPFQNDFFDSAICVGSVINYCNALAAISEISRVLKSEAYIILEYERSNTGELFFCNEYGKSSSLQIYDYNNQKGHKLWLYSDKYIDNILSACNIRVINAQYYHCASAVVNHFMHDEAKAGNYCKYDKYILNLAKKKCAHNRILLAKKL